MLILAIESSAKPASVAVYDAFDYYPDNGTDGKDGQDNEHGNSGSGKLDVINGNDGKLLGQYFQNNGFSHSRTLLVMAESLLKNLDLKPSDIGLIAVARGPGSFTGIRIGVSAAKGLAWGLDIPVCGVSTLEAMAYQTPVPGVIICPVMDARRDQVYNALFEWRDGSLVRLCDDRAISLEDLASELRRHDKPCMPVGDGAAIAHGCIAHCCSVPELMRYQTAYGVALAALHTKPIPATDLEPCYLRPSQAERVRTDTGI